MSRTLLALGVALIALIGGGVSLHDGSELRLGSDTRVAWFVAMQMLAVALYFIAVARVLRDPRTGWRATSRDVWVVVAVAVAMRAIPLFSPIFLSSDMFRYIWDGRVQLAGINPYRYVPADPALAGLRDAAIFPHVYRADYAHTIYPPMAQLVFVAVAWISQAPFAMRLVMVAFEALAVVCLLRALMLRGQNPARVLIYAWNPLAAWEFAGNGHVDAIAIGCLAVALLARTAGRPAATGVALAASALVKFMPAVVAPALWRPMRGRPEWRLPVAAVVTVAILYACYAGVGWRVFGFMSGYADEEGMQDGTGIWALAGLAHLTDLPSWAGTAWMGLVGLGLALASLRLLLRPAADPARAACWLMLAVMLALSPHYPWYYVWVAVPAVLAPVRAAIWVAAAATLLYLSPLHERFIWAGLVFVPALVLVALDLRRAKAPVPTLALATGK